MSSLVAYMSNILCELDKLKDDEDGLLEYLDSDLGYYIVNNTIKDFEGVMIDLTLGGPTVWLDTRHGVLCGTWGMESCIMAIPGEITAAINELGYLF